MTSFANALRTVKRFRSDDLTAHIRELEHDFSDADRSRARKLLKSQGVDQVLLRAAHLIKQETGQINTIIHAVTILLILPRILENGEQVMSLSLGAGNTGRQFDLETNRRIAEFKLIDWKGGAEAVRQNSLFKDFYSLAESEGRKKRYLYVNGTEFPLRFLNGNRSLQSVMSRGNKLWAEFRAKYRDRFTYVSEYYKYRKRRVRLEDISTYL
jgi:hypothetical protein